MALLLCLLKKTDSTLQAMRVIKRWAIILGILSWAVISILEILLWNKQAPQKNGGLQKMGVKEMGVKKTLI